MACAERAYPAHVACIAARDAALEAGRIVITTDFVIDETLTLIRFRLGLAAANAWWQQVDGSARLRWERVDHDRFELARNLFCQARPILQHVHLQRHLRDIEVHHVVDGSAGNGDELVAVIVAWESDSPSARRTTALHERGCSKDG